MAWAGLYGNPDDAILVLGGRMAACKMTDAALGATPTLRFSTEELPPRERAAIWHEMISRCLMRVEVDRPSGQSPFHELSMWALPGAALVFGNGAACTA